MDLWNNAQGVEIANEVGNDLYKKYGKKFDILALYPRVKSMIAEKVNQRMKAGQLITHPDDPRRYVPKNKKEQQLGKLHRLVIL